MQRDELVKPEMNRTLRNHYLHSTKVAKPGKGGSPLAREALYDLLRKQWPADTPFHKLLLTSQKISALSQWISRSLKRRGWTVRKSTVSQKVPDNWVEVAQIESERICQAMRDATVYVLINADKTFFQFFPEDAHVIAPVGSK